MTVEEFLAAEVHFDVKHEYLGGAVYAMAGASEAHNIIAMNLYAMLHRQLRRKPCQAFGSDMKVRIHPANSTYFYYPDAMIACDPADRGHGWRERPSALFEILSPDTRHVDEREKRLAYFQIESLKAYLRIEQNRPEVVIDRSLDGLHVERVRGLEGVARLPELDLELPLAELYESVTFGSSGEV